jgi:hypothetical protein
MFSAPLASSLRFDDGKLPCPTKIDELDVYKDSPAGEECGM